MPELPEVETIRKDLTQTILYKEIKDVEILYIKAFINPQNLKITGKIDSIDRIGKYLILNIKDAATIVIHLRMTGKLVFTPIYEGGTPPLTEGERGNHIRIVFTFTDDTSLYFHDVRKFGRCEVYPYRTPLSQVKNIGIDAISPDFTQKKMLSILSNRAKPLYSLLLDQTVIAGIGNIYMQEILFDAHISPLRLAKSLTEKETKRLYQSNKKILSLAIAHNGTSISDFRRVDDKTGEFQNFLQVYGKKTCPTCHIPLTKFKKAGRTTTYCEKCQK